MSQTPEACHGTFFNMRGVSSIGLSFLLAKLVLTDAWVLVKFSCCEDVCIVVDSYNPKEERQAFALERAQALRAIIKGNSVFLWI